MCKSNDCDHKKKTRKLIVGVNDLATTHPEIAAMAHGWDPKTVKAGSEKKLQFRCKLGHLPSPVIVYNKIKYGPDSCAICSNQEVLVGYNDLETTHPEIAKQAWGWDPKTVTAGSMEPKRFRCKLGHLPSPTLVYCKAACGPDSCAICSGREVLVGFNDLATTHPDVASQAFGWDPQSVTAGSHEIRQFFCKFGHLPKPVVVFNQSRRGPDSCAICSNKEVLVGYNDLATTHPEIAAMAYGWSPKTVTAGCNEKRQFMCQLGHLPSPSQVSSQVRRGPGSCTICSNKEVLIGYNDLATTHKEVAKQAYNWDARTVTAGSNRKMRFCCDLGHISAPMRVNFKAQSGPGSGCKQCARYGFKPESPSFFYLIEKPGLFKLGIANHGSGRLDQHRRAGWELIEAIDMVGHAAWELEKTLKATFIAQGIPIGQFRETFPGSTESWYKHDLDVRTIRSLCKKLEIDLDIFLAQ